MSNSIAINVLQDNTVCC